LYKRGTTRTARRTDQALRSEDVVASPPAHGGFVRSPFTTDFEDISRAADISGSAFKDVNSATGFLGAPFKEFICAIGILG